MHVVKVIRVIVHVVIYMYFNFPASVALNFARLSVSCILGADIECKYSLFHYGGKKVYCALEHLWLHCMLAESCFIHQLVVIK